MAHAPGWIELYTLLETGATPPQPLVAQCLANRNGIGETMLHWYALEGDPVVLRRIVDLGFDLDARDDGGSTPLLSAALISRWDNVRVLRAAGASRRGTNDCGCCYRGEITKQLPDVPEDLRADAFGRDDLLDQAGPQDGEVLLLVITRDGVDGGTGTELDADSWARWCASRGHAPDAAPFGGGFTAEPGLYDGPRVEVWHPDHPARQAVSAAAEHFGARVIWEIVAGDAP